MAVISLRLNQNEESMVTFLSNYYERDRTSLIRYSLKELYEDIIDKRVINEFETQEQNGDTAFVDAEEILRQAVYA